jgi:hypothetical protein
MTSREITPVENQRSSEAVSIQRLAEELYRERVVEARAMPPADKLLAGEELWCGRHGTLTLMEEIRHSLPPKE